MQRQELAKALGVSPSMVTRYAKRGMPTDSVERAQRWRRRHLEAPRRKENRFDPNGPAIQAPPVPPPPPPPASSEHERQARILAHGLRDCITPLSLTVAWIEPEHPAYGPALDALRLAVRHVPGELQPQIAHGAWLALLDWVLAASNAARHSTDGAELLDPDEFATLAGGFHTGRELLDLAGTEPEPDQGEEDEL